MKQRGERGGVWSGQGGQTASSSSLSFKAGDNDWTFRSSFFPINSSNSLGCETYKIFCLHRSTPLPPLQALIHVSSDFICLRLCAGVCDCCDGSDEVEGQCPNRCKEMSLEYLEAVKEEYKVLMEGR